MRKSSSTDQWVRILVLSMMKWSKVTDQRDLHKLPNTSRRLKGNSWKEWRIITNSSWRNKRTSMKIDSVGLRVSSKSTLVKWLPNNKSSRGKPLSLDFKHNKYTTHHPLLNEWSITEQTLAMIMMIKWLTWMPQDSRYSSNNYRWEWVVLALLKSIEITNINSSNNISSSSSSRLGHQTEETTVMYLLQWMTMVKESK